MRYLDLLRAEFASSLLVQACGDDAPPPGGDSGAAPPGAVSPDTGRDAEPVTAAGEAGADTASSAGGQATCGVQAGSAGPALHQAALGVRTPMTPCGFSDCHVGRGKAGLSLLAATDLRALLVNKPACEAPSLSLVDGSGGAAALAKSWLWLKLTSAADVQNALPDNPTWGTAGNCGQLPDQPYGVLMPLGSPKLDVQRLAPIRDWICAGAPGP